MPSKQCRIVSRLIALLLTGALWALFIPPISAQAVSTSAASAILMEADSGRVLYAQDERTPRPIASVTKLMTALVAVERCPDLNTPVTVDPAAVGVEGSSLYLAPGEVLPLEHLLYGLLLHSGNDAAVAIAIHCAGDVATFAQWMNEKAQALGMTASHFVNPNGLDGEGHYSCAYDLALLAQAVLQSEALARIVATRSITLGTRSFVNHNKLLGRYEGCIGLKTGFTKKAGRTLVSAARRGETTLIAVTLNDGNDWADHAALFDYGFATWRSHLLARSGKPMGLVAVEGSLIPAVAVETRGEVRSCLASGETPIARLLLPQPIVAPIQAGQSVGALIFYLNGRELGRTELVATRSAPAHRRR